MCCKRCDIISNIRNHLLLARVANHLNLSIVELNNIISNTEEHERYDEVMLLMSGITMPSSTVITNDIISDYLGEDIKVI